MSQLAQSILSGSSQPHSLDLGAFRITSAHFPGELELQPHFHPRACLAVVLHGQVEKAFRTTTYNLSSHFACTMPPEERHSDKFAVSGAHMLVVEPAFSAEASLLLAPCKELLHEVRYVGNPYISLLAARLDREMRQPDSLSNLVVNGLVFELLAMAARGVNGGNLERTLPSWLARARDCLHDQFAAPLQLNELAETVGVHPVYLARAFRRFFGTTPGEYVRRLRVEWVKEHLMHGNLPLAQLAQEAGFSDQSHLTRQFKAHFGVTPGQLRRHSLQ